MVLATPRPRRAPALALLALLLANLLALGAGPGGGLRPDAALPVHPLLQVGARLEPDRPVRLLVQLDPARTDAAAIARAAGAPIEEAFALIDAVALTVPQRAAPALGRLPGVRAVTPDALAQRTSIETTYLRTTYQAAIGLPAAWNGNNSSEGGGVVIAVVDSGVDPEHPALKPQGKTSCVVVNPKARDCRDAVGHGTHIAGILAGRDVEKRYVGVAPEAEVIGVKVADDAGAVTEADILRGLEWVFDQRAARKIRVVNLSVASSVPASYLVSPLGAAVEKLWRAGVVVVAAAGNEGAAPGAMQ
jgi:serine protease AprX